MQPTPMHWIALGGYVFGALLLVQGGNGLLRELSDRRRKVAEASRRILAAGTEDLGGLINALEINKEANQGLERLLQAQVDGGPEAYAKVMEESRNIEIRLEEMRLQGLRGDSIAARITSEKDQLDEALHGVAPRSPEDDAKAARTLAQKLRLAQKDKMVTLGGLILTTFASCLSLFIP